MDFFSLQDDARARSRRFFWAFGVVIVLAVVIIYFAITGGFFAFRFSPRETASFYPPLPPSIYGYPPKVLSLKPFLIIGSVVTLIILSISIRRTRFIREGGGAYIAEILGARLLETPANLKESQLINIVEEISVAAGLPRPRLYIIPGIRSINAITAGVDHEDAIIAITEGAVKHLNRDELQGVIAHEFAHILNGDYSLNLTMAGWLYGLMFFHIQGRRLFFLVWEAAFSLGDKDDLRFVPSGCLVSVPAMITGGLLMAAGWIGKVGAQIIQAAFSRQREYLADAFAVQFTRNPAGLAGAMKKIAWTPRHGFIQSSDAMTMQAFFIVSPAKFQGIFQSHPPLEERILLLDPAWDGEPQPIDHDDFRPPKNVNEKYGYGPSTSAAPKNLSKNRQLLAAKSKNMDAWSNLLLLRLVEAGEAGPAAGGESLKAARDLYREISPVLLEAVDDTNQAAILTAAVFIQEDATVRRYQQHIIEKSLGIEAAARALDFAGRMNPNQRLPLLSLAVPTLKSLTQEERDGLVVIIQNLAAADKRLDLFEIAGCQILKKSLGNILQASAEGEGEAGFYPDKVRRHVVTVLSLLANLDSGSETEAGEIFAKAMNSFNQWPPQPMLARGQVTSKVLIESLDYLAGAPEKVRKSMVQAAAVTCLNKDKMSDKQYQLLRALAAALDVPLPLAS